MNLIKVKFLKGSQPTGRAYTYNSPEPVEIGDIVKINNTATGIVTDVDVPKEEVAAFRDNVKSIVGLVEIEEKKDEN